MDRKIIPFLLSFILMLALTAPMDVRISYAKPEDEASTEEADPAASGEEQSEGEAGVATWDALQASIDGSKEETTLTLAGDITAGSGMAALTVRKGKKIIIDLKGHTLNRGLTSAANDGEVIHVENGGTLTLTDSTDTPGASGTITGGSNTGNGGGVLVDDGGVLTVDGGVKITHNYANNGAGICLGAGGYLYLGTCTISENSCAVFGGGIYGGSSYVVFLGGRPRIRENYKGSDTADANDLYIPAEMEKLRFWYVTGAGTKKEKEVYCDEFKRGTSVGILLEEVAKVISDGYGQCNQVEASTFFFYDNDSLMVSDDNTKSEITILKTEAGLQSTSKCTVEIYRNSKLKSSVQYNSLPEAISYAVNGGGDENVVMMGSDHTSDQQIVIEKGKSVVIDLNGHYIKRNREDYDTQRNGGVILVKEGATLTIRDSSPKFKGYDGIKGGVITGGGSSNGGGGITVEEKGHLIMEGGTIYDCVSDEDGGGVYVDTGSKETSFTMTGGRIYNCKTIESADECYGGAIYFGDGKLDLRNGKIDSCYSEDDGGAIYCKRGEVYLENMIFSTNKSVDSGGAIYIDLDLAKYDGTLFYAKGCSFIENEAMDDGGAFFMRDNPQLKGALMFDHCIFRNNEARGDGGALYARDDGMVLSNVEITGNKAKGYGGGVFVDARYTVSVKGVVVIKDNTSDKDSCTRDLCLEDGISNTAYLNSGGLTKGSWIGIGSTSKKSIRLSKKISVYEMKYFHSHVGSITAKNKTTVDVPMVVTASLFGKGSLLRVIMIGGALLLVIAVVLILRYSHKAKVADNSKGGGL